MRSVIHVSMGRVGRRIDPCTTADWWYLRSISSDIPIPMGNLGYLIMIGYRDLLPNSRLSLEVI